MALLPYHQKYARQTDAEILKRAEAKKQELGTIFEQVKFGTESNPIRIAVLGCGDKRFVRHHRGIFESLLKNDVEMTTLDIATEHLAGEPNIVGHDCVLPLPTSPYDITFAHVLLRFIETEKQWAVIQNSYDALQPGGLAIHVLDRQDYEIQDTLLPDGQFSVPVERWEEKLRSQQVQYVKIPLRHGLALVIEK